DIAPPALRGATRRCEALPLTPYKKTHNLCNCRNSIAVRFELRCSDLELFCSESAGKPPGSESPLGTLNQNVSPPYLAARNSTTGYPSLLPFVREFRFTSWGSSSTIGPGGRSGPG